MEAAAVGIDAGILSVCCSPDGGFWADDCICIDVGIALDVGMTLDVGMALDVGICMEVSIDIGPVGMDFVIEVSIDMGTVGIDFVIPVEVSMGTDVSVDLVVHGSVSVGLIL